MGRRAVPRHPIWRMGRVTRNSDRYHGVSVANGGVVLGGMRRRRGDGEQGSGGDGQEV